MKDSGIHERGFPELLSIMEKEGEQYEILMDFLGPNVRELQRRLDKQQFPVH